MSKRILITGVGGFVASHLLEHTLKMTDWDIVAMCRLNTIGDMRRVTGIEGIEKYKDRVKFIYHDLKSEIHDGIAEQIGHVDFIAHLAANSHVARSIIFPKEFFEDNVMGTVNLLEWYRTKNSDARLLSFGTDEQFGPAPDGYDFKEDDRWRPSNAYSASKCGQAAAAYSYFVTYGLDIILSQTMNIYGERQSPEKFVPMCLKNCIEGKEQMIHAELKPGVDSTYYKDEVLGVGQRHWLYARNAADATLFLLKNGKSGEFYNIVGDIELDNDEMANTISEIVGKPLKLKYVDVHKQRKGHDRRYALDNTKITQLGWEPPVEFRESLEKTIKWTIEHGGF